jgi:hypothetical protein
MKNSVLGCNAVKRGRSCVLLTFSALKTETICSFETSVNLYWTSWFRVVEDSTLPRKCVTKNTHSNT